MSVASLIAEVLTIPSVILMTQSASPDDIEPIIIVSLATFKDH